MAAKVYTFHIAYAGMEAQLWRDVEVSSRYRLDQLGYMVLAIFDTMAYHLFEIECRGVIYALPDPDNPPEYRDLADYPLEKLALTPGEQLELVYDLGTEQHFLLTLTDVQEMKCGKGRHYPWVTGMQGRGIIDDVSVEELKELVHQIQENGKTKVPIYYSRSGFGEESRMHVPWDIDRFDLETENELLKTYIGRVARGYAPFWTGEQDRV